MPDGVLQFHGVVASARLPASDQQVAYLADGAAARVTSSAGSLTAPLEVTDAVAKGVVSLPHGFGHDLPGTRLRVAARQPGVNVNLLATADRVDPLSGNPHLNGIEVDVGPVQPQ